MPFYERRKDIFDMFDDEQVVRTFRFDKQTIFYITGLVKEGLPQRHTKCEHKLLPVDQVLLALQFFDRQTALVFSKICDISSNYFTQTDNVGVLRCLFCRSSHSRRKNCIARIFN